MAVRALHALRQMRVLEMNRLRELHRVIVRDVIVVEVQQVALAVLLEHRAKDPAVPVIIRELRLLQLGIQLGDLLQELHIAPQPARCRRFRILLHRFDHLRRRRVLLLLRIHEFTVALLIPPDVAKVRIHEEIPLVHVAVHALRRRDGARELMLDRVPALVFANRLVLAEAQSLVAVFGVPARVRRRTIICINDVAGRAAARPVIARMIVRPHEVQQRIVQPRLLQIEQHRINAVERAETAFRQTTQRLAGRLERIRVAELKLLLAATLEDAQQIARLADGEARQRIDEGKNAVGARHFWRDRNGTFQTQRHAIETVSLAEAIILRGIRAVVVERGAPQHRAMPHHAVPDVAHDLAVTGAARLFRHAQIAGVHELDELGGLMIEQHGGIARVGRALPEDGIARQDVRVPLRQAGRGVATVTICAAQHDVRRRVHRLDAGMTFETAAALAGRFRHGLINDISRREPMRGITRKSLGNRNLRTAADVVLSLRCEGERKKCDDCSAECNSRSRVHASR